MKVNVCLLMLLDAMGPRCPANYASKQSDAVIAKSPKSQSGRFPAKCSARSSTTNEETGHRGRPPGVFGHDLLHVVFSLNYNAFYRVCNYSL